MAVIPRKAGSASARPRSDGGTVTILGRQPFLATSTDALGSVSLEAGEQLHFDALMARTRRTWADRLAIEEAELAPEAAEGFAARMDAAFDAERERTLADLPLRLRVHAQPRLGAIGAEIIDAARVYEGMAARIGQFNTAKRATDDLAALIAHDRTTHDRLRDEGLAMLAAAPLSGGARALLGERLVAELAHSFAASHIDDDPAGAHAALMTAGPGEEPSPYDALTDAQRQRYALRALTEGARRHATAQFTARQNHEVAIDAGEPETISMRTVDERQVNSASAGMLAGKVPRDPQGPDGRADAERAWTALGGSAERIATGDEEAVDLLVWLAWTTGIVPVDVQAELERLNEEGTPVEREFAGDVLDELPVGESYARALEAVEIFSDFGLSDHDLESVSRETSPEELASWLSRLRDLNQPDSDNSHRKREYRERIFEALAGRPATMSLVFDRYRMVAGDKPDIRGNPEMFPPEFAARYGALLDRNEAWFSHVIDFTPVVGEVKAAFELGGILLEWKRALDVGEEEAAQLASADFFIKLTDLFPGPSIVHAAKKLMAKIDGWPLPQSFKEKVRSAFDEQSLLDERKWRKRGRGQRVADNATHGARGEEDSTADIVEQGAQYIQHRVGIKTKFGMRFIDKSYFDKDRKLRFREDKTEPPRSKRTNKRRMPRQDPKQKSKDMEIKGGRGEFRRDVPPSFKKGDRVPPIPVEMNIGKPTPTGWKKIWHLRIMKKWRSWKRKR
jgi:hypothetical protein